MIALASRHSFRAAYNYPIMSRVLGRYVSYAFLPLLVSVMGVLSESGRWREPLFTRHGMLRNLAYGLLAVGGVLLIRHSLHVIFYRTVYSTSGGLLQSRMINPEGIIWQGFLPGIAYAIAVCAVGLLVVDRLRLRWTAAALTVALVGVNLIGMGVTLETTRSLESRMPNVGIARPLTEELRGRVGASADSTVMIVNDSGLSDARIQNGLTFFDIDDELSQVEVISIDPAVVVGSDFLLTRELLAETPDAIFDSGGNQYFLYDLSDTDRAQSLSEALYERQAQPTTP